MSPHGISPPLLLVYFGMLIAFSMLKARPISGRATHLLRAFFPSWKFFEDSGDIAVLFFRIGARGQECGTWEAALPAPERSLKSLLWNPEGCFLLAAGSLLQQLASDLQEIPDGKENEFADSVSYELVRNLVRHAITQKYGDLRNHRYQFKVCAVSPGLSSYETTGEEMLVSPIYED